MKSIKGAYKRRPTEDELIEEKVYELEHGVKLNPSGVPRRTKVKRTFARAHPFAMRSIGTGRNMIGINPFKASGALIGGRGAIGGRLQLSQESVTIPLWNMTYMDRIKSAWPEDIDGFKIADVFDTSFDPAYSIGNTQNKGKFLMFDDNIYTNYWSQMLSPMYGGPIVINVPVEGVTYKSPMHYVAGMQILASATPGMLFGGVAQAVFNGGLPTDACDLARFELDDTLDGKFAESVAIRASQCDKKARDNRFWDIDSEPCHYFTSMWLALFAKHMRRGAIRARGSYLDALTSTGKKFLIYSHPNINSEMFGYSSMDFSEIKAIFAGYNMVGIMLMLLRTLAIRGQLIEENAGPAWEKIAKPIITKYMAVMTPIYEAQLAADRAAVQTKP